VSEMTGASDRSLAALLRRRAVESPDRGYTWLAQGEEVADRLTYAGLDARARAIAAGLAEAVPPGERALLLYPPGLEFVAAFFGCLYAGVIAVPAYPPHSRRRDPRLAGIAGDCRPRAVLTTASLLARREALAAQVPALAGALWIATEMLGEDAAAPSREPRAEDVAFLQYTSGSTGTPKGVVVTHANLLDNLERIRVAFGQTPESVVVGWLPLFHDMGLIGNVLEPCFVGADCVLMSPAAFLQKPARWLRAIHRFRGTTSGGPNFAYDLCARSVGPEAREELDLSSWSVAFNGAEPVRGATLERFADAFAPSGFQRASFVPCYGLAEATLLVTAGRFSGEPVSCGAPGGGEVLVVESESGAPCAGEAVGEIWVAGPSVAQGYWEQPAETARTFQARLADTGEGPFLRTGDLGFLQDGQLFVTGRLKDLIIIRGRNYYPQDIELTAERSHPALRPGCGAAFAVEEAGEERLVLVQELDRQHRSQDAAPVLDAVRRAVAQEHGLSLHTVVLIRHGSALKTSSGKIQRGPTRDAFREGRLEVVGQHVLQAEQPAVAGAVRLSQLELERLLVEIWQRTLGLERISVHDNFFELGVDSVSAVRVAEQIKAALGVDVSAVSLYEQLNIRSLAEAIAQERRTGPAHESRARRQYRQVKRSERLVAEEHL